MRSRRVLPHLAVVAGLLLGGNAVARAQPAESAGGATETATVVTNADVVRMLRSGLDDDEVIAAIRKARTEFDLSSPALEELRYAGVSDAVIVAMLDSTNREPDTRTPAAEPAPPPPAPPVPATAAPAQPAPARDTAPATPAFRGSRAGRPAPSPAPRRGGLIFGLTLGGNYAFFVEQGSSEDEPRFGASLGLRLGGRAGRHLAILADAHASLWPATDEYESTAVFSLGPAVRFSPLPRLSLGFGLGVALGLPALRDVDWASDPWLGPTGHLEAAVELTNGRGRFALELAARFDLTHLSEVDCEACETATLGRVTSQLAFTWH